LPSFFFPVTIFDYIFDRYISAAPFLAFFRMAISFHSRQGFFFQSTGENFVSLARIPIRRERVGWRSLPLPFLFLMRRNERSTFSSPEQFVFRAPPARSSFFFLKDAFSTTLSSLPPSPRESLLSLPFSKTFLPTFFLRRFTFPPTAKAGMSEEAFLPPFLRQKANASSLEMCEELVFSFFKLWKCFLSSPPQLLPFSVKKDACESSLMPV